MAFEITRFTEDGLDLLSQISSSKALKIKNIYCDSAYHDDADLDQDAYWWASQTTATMAKIDATLAAISPVEGQARIIIDLALKAGQTSDVTIRTVVVTACTLESGVEGEEVVFVGTTDQDGVEVIYRSGITISTSISLYFKFNNTANIEIDTGLIPNYVVHSELERFVSCHALGSVSTGEAQTILGEKTFAGDTRFLNSIEVSSEFEDVCGSISSYYDTDDDSYKGVLVRSKNIESGVMVAFSDYDAENEVDAIAASITKEKAGYNLNVNGTVTGGSFITEYTQGSSEYRVSQMGDKLRLSLDNGETFTSFDLGFTVNGNFGVLRNNEALLEVTPESTIISGKAEIGGGVTLDLDVNGSNVPGTVKMAYSENTGAMMTFGVGDSLDDPNRVISLSIYQDSIHTYKTLIAESGLVVTGGLTANKFYGNLSGCIPEPLNQYDCQLGTLCVIKATTANGAVLYNNLLRGDRIVKVDAQGNWSKVGSSQTFQIALASFDGTIANTTPNLGIGNRFAILTSGGNDGTYLAMSIGVAGI